MAPYITSHFCWAPKKLTIIKQLKMFNIKFNAQKNKFKFEFIHVNGRHKSLKPTFEYLLIMGTTTSQTQSSNFDDLRTSKF